MMFLSILGSPSLVQEPSTLYFRSNNFNTSAPLATAPICMDRCDVSGLCGTGGETCAELTQSYSCDEYYAAGKEYAGWCDKTCKFAACATSASGAARAGRANARVVHWDATYRNFDSPKDVHVTRFDVFNALEDVRLGGEHGVLSLPAGAAYIFTTAPLLTITDVAAGASTVQTSYATEAAWVSKGSCLTLDVAASGAANVSVIIVSSGAFNSSLPPRAATECSASTMEIGYDSLHNNPVDYEVEGSCSSVLSGPPGANDFDDLDAPIRPLVSHYHTRAALYYTAAGSSSFNDAGEGAVTSGEIRWVTQGHYYGPETMWGDNYFVMSFHESDPSARSTATSNPPSGFTPCAFACLDKPSDDSSSGLMKCVLPKANAEQAKVAVVEEKHA